MEDPDPAHLAALVAIIDHGSFDAAARWLQITPSAVSQRIRALEARAGQVLVVRASPCRATSAGEAWVRLGRQLRLLIDEVGHTYDAVVPEARVAVNADSLATWFRPVVTEVARWQHSQPSEHSQRSVALRLYVEDQAWSSELLRSGEVLAAVTSDPHPVQGCAVEPLGLLRYVAVASAPVAALEWERRPMVVFNEKDSLQHDYLAQIGVPPPSLVHRVPTSADFAEAVRLGLGWALLPEPQAAPWLASGEVVRLGRGRVDVPLWWQRWRVESALLADLSVAVRSAARAGLRE